MSSGGGGGPDFRIKKLERTVRNLKKNVKNLERHRQESKLRFREHKLRFKNLEYDIQEVQQFAVDIAKRVQGVIGPVDGWNTGNWNEWNANEVVDQRNGENAEAEPRGKRRKKSRKGKDSDIQIFGEHSNVERNSDSWRAREILTNNQTETDVAGGTALVVNKNGISSDKAVAVPAPVGPQLIQTVRGGAGPEPKVGNVKSIPAKPEQEQSGNRNKIEKLKDLSSSDDEDYSQSEDSDDTIPNSDLHLKLRPIQPALPDPTIEAEHIEGVEQRKDNQLVIGLRPVTKDSGPAPQPRVPDISKGTFIGRKSSVAQLKRTGITSHFGTIRLGPPGLTGSANNRKALNKVNGNTVQKESEPNSVNSKPNLEAMRNRKSATNGEFEHMPPKSNGVLKSPTDNVEMAHSTSLVFNGGKPNQIMQATSSKPQFKYIPISDSEDSSTSSEDSFRGKVASTKTMPKNDSGCESVTSIRVKGAIPQTLYECSVCHDVFTKKSDLTIHTARQHKKSNSVVATPKPPMTKAAPFKCTVCASMFSSKWGLSRHINTVHQNRQNQVVKNRGRGRPNGSAGRTLRRSSRQPALVTESNSTAVTELPEP